MFLRDIQAKIGMVGNYDMDTLEFVLHMGSVYNFSALYNIAIELYQH